MFKRARCKFERPTLAAAALWGVTFAAGAGARAALPTAAPRFVVGDLADAVDSAPGDGKCATSAATCTLRAAIQESNAGAGGATIVLGDGVHVLSVAGTGEDRAAAGDLDLARDVSIVGRSAAATIVDAAGIDRAFHVLKDVSAALAGIGIQNGDVAGPGGAILSEGTLTLDAVAIVHNTAASGGGAIFASGEKLLLSHADVRDNESTNWPGGALYNDGARVEIVRSALRANATTDSGGAIFSLAGRLEISDSTISGNAAGSYGGGIDAVGGDFVGRATIELRSVTIVGNLAALAGHAISADTVAGSIRDTVVDSALPASNCFGLDFGMAIDSRGHNLESGDSCGFVEPTDRPDTPPQLGPLAASDGAPPTHEPRSGSPLVDSGSALCAPTDQRGRPRFVDGDADGHGACDIGAVETCRRRHGTDACANGAALVDADASSYVDGVDLARLGRSFGTSCAGERYDPGCDFDRNCTVDGHDLAEIAAHFGERLPED